MNSGAEDQREAEHGVPGGRSIVWPLAMTMTFAWSLSLPWSLSTHAVAQPYWVGIDFIDVATPSPSPFFFDFEPFALTDPANYMVSEGALAGWSEAAAQRATALAVEDAFNAVDVGDPGQQLRLGLVLGPVPETDIGQRLNIMIGQSASSTSVYGETPRPGDYYNLSATDQHVAAVYVDNLDGLGESTLDFLQPDDAINVVAGTTAHEIGHVFGLDHTSVFALDVAPWPLMAVEATGLPTAARQSVRQFSTSKPAGQSSAATLIDVLGVRPRGDYNLDHLVDEDDLAVLLANLGQRDRLGVEGDANGDHIVDGADAAWLVANWTAAPVGLSAGVASAGLPVPEPGGLAAAWILAGLGWRCRKPHPGGRRIGPNV